MAAPTTHEHQPTYIREMMEHLGIEPSGGAVPRLGLIYTTAFHRCEACQSKQACRDWLDSMAGSVEFAPHFCPNADILFELQVNQPSNRAHSYIEPKILARNQAHISDLERLEDEINEIVIYKSADPSLVADLRRRRSHLRGQIELLCRQAPANRRPN